jgi:hypothetical protein
MIWPADLFATASGLMIAKVRWTSAMGNFLF